MNFLYKIFSKYFEQYKVNVVNKIGSLVRTTDEEVLEVCLDELNSILEIISGRKTSYLDIPQRNKFPSTKEFNVLLSNINIDLDKLFTSNKLLIEDVQNVVNYNSTERTAITKLLSETQGSVYSAYISTRKGINGTTIIKENFISEDSTNILSVNSKNVAINPTLKRLSLTSLSAEPILDNSAVMNEMVDASHFIAQSKTFNLYPNHEDLAKGSYWKVRGSEHHHTGRYEKRYSERLTVRKTNTSHSRRSRASSPAMYMNTGRGGYRGGATAINQTASCQFESVITLDRNKDLELKIQKQFANVNSIPDSYIFIDRPISINSKYIADNYYASPDAKIKLKIPFQNAVLSTGCVITLNPNDDYEWPAIIVANSFVRTDVTINDIGGSNKVGVSVISNATLDDIGATDRKFTVVFDRPIIPTMLELEFVYDRNSGWANVSYYMQEWYTEITKVIDIKTQIEGLGNEVLTIEYKRPVHILIDDLGNDSIERHGVKELLALKGVK